MLNLSSPSGVTRDAQRETLNFIQQMDRSHLATKGGDSTLEARIASYELAFRMQSEAPGAVDLTKETEPRGNYTVSTIRLRKTSARSVCSRGVL